MVLVAKTIVVEVLAAGPLTDLETIHVDVMSYF